MLQYTRFYVRRMAAKTTRNVIVFLLRHRRNLLTSSYIALGFVLVLVIYDPTLLTFLLPLESATDLQSVESTTTFQHLIRPTASKIIRFPFVPHDFLCEEMYQKSRRNFTYPEGYLDHSDAFKSALSLNNLIEHAVASDQTWIVLDIARQPFVATACETGFKAGHVSFHILAGNSDLVVHSFENLKRFNYTMEMADFMTIEFPDRFNVYDGDSVEKSISGFIDQQGNKTKCDLIFLDSSTEAEKLSQQFKLFQRLANPLENVVIVNAHPENVVRDLNGASDVWERMKADHVIVEHFRCYSAERDISANQMGLLIGSFKV